jgi:hypothetical protein
MSITGGLEIHRKQLTFDWFDEQSDNWERSRISRSACAHRLDLLRVGQGSLRPERA